VPAQVTAQRHRPSHSSAGAHSDRLNWDMVRRTWLLALAASIPCGCSSKRDASTECIYANVHYSIGATLCAPGGAESPNHIVLECTFNGAHEPPRWINTGRPCDPPVRATEDVTGSGSKSHSGAR
jgi:hypothetical protein